MQKYWNQVQVLFKKKNKCIIIIIKKINNNCMQKVKQQQQQQQQVKQCKFMFKFRRKQNYNIYKHCIEGEEEASVAQEEAKESKKKEKQKPFDKLGREWVIQTANI